MNLFSAVERVMLTLSTIPGLRFLSSYVTDFHTHKGRIQHQVSNYQGYVRSVRQAGSDVAEVGRGSKREKPSEDDEDVEEYPEEYDEDDDESYMQGV